MTEQALDQQADEQIDQTVENTEEKPEIPEGFIPFDENQRQVNKQHKRFRDEERAHSETQKALEEAQKRLQELEVSEIKIPEPPDPLDEDFQQKQEAREEAVKQAARQEARLDAAKADEARQAERAKAEQDRAQAEKVSGFDAQTLQLGLNPLEMKKAADTVLGYGVSPTLEDAILVDEDGPLFLTYLASNPIELEKLNEMSPFQLATHLNSEVRPKAQSLKPKTSQAPAPPETLDGGGVQEIEDPLLKGAKFE